MTEADAEVVDDFGGWSRSDHLVGGPQLEAHRTAAPGSALPGTHARHEQEAAPAAIGQPLAEVVGEIEMRECVESQHAVEAFAVVLEHVLEEPQRSACIGNNQTHVEVGSCLLECFQKPLVRQVEADSPVLDPEFVREVLTETLERLEPPRDQDQIEPAAARWRANCLPMPEDDP